MKIESIKFKAKRLDGKGWVCGYFYEENCNTYIIENRQKESKLNRNLTYQVDHSTVCQFIGLTDYDGKDLYEGDIIYFSDSYNQVVWEDDLCAFVLVGVESHRYYVHCDILKNLPFYIVGNKFDKEK